MEKAVFEREKLELDFKKKLSDGKLKFEEEVSAKNTRFVKVMLSY